MRALILAIALALAPALAAAQTIRVPNPPVSRILAQSAVTGMSVTGTTSKTTLATITIPAGTMGPNSALRLTTTWSATNNANVKTVTVDLGTFSFTPTLTSLAAAQYQYVYRARGATNSQVVYSSVNVTTTGAINTGAIDFTAAQTITISGTLATGTDTVTLEGYTVEILN